MVGAAVAATTLAPVLASPASAVPCIPTDFMQDGLPLTAAVVNDPTVTGAVDATGCDIAVYFNDGNAHTIDAATIQNARYYGVLVRNTGTTATITNSEVRFIG